MRHARWLPVALIVLLAFFPVRSAGQGSIRKASPPVFKYELNRPEPAENVPVVNYSVGGGGGLILNEIPGSGVRWGMVPDALSRPGEDWNEFFACGIPDNKPPSATLTLPSGKQNRVSMSYRLFPGCWYYALGWTNGMELGTYTLTVQSGNTRLNHQWRIEWPKTPMVVLPNSGEARFKRNVNGTDVLFMGFQPGQSLRVHFFVFQSLPEKTTFLASRVLKTDQNGTALVRASFARSSPYHDGYLRLEVGGYPLCLDLTQHHNLYDLPPFLRFFNRQAVPRLKAGQTGHVTPGDPNNLNSAPARAQTNPDSKKLGTIPGGASFTVLSGPVCSDEHYWYRVRYNGQEGWTAEGRNIGTVIGPSGVVEQYWLAPGP